MGLTQMISKLYSCDAIYEEIFCVNLLLSQVPFYRKKTVENSKRRF